MKTAIELADEFPEQNPGNFEHDAALRLNDWGIEAHAMLRQQAEQLKADAERYRWLSRNPTYLGWDADFEAEFVDFEVDKAIDAMKGKS